MTSGELVVDCSFTEDASWKSQVVKIGTTKINDNEYFTHLTVSFEHVPEPVGKDIVKLLAINRIIYR
jgi:hypothetical protein